jgi:hypothetical protein
MKTSPNEKPMTIATQYLMQPVPDLNLPQGWLPTQIIYLKISVKMTTDGLEIFYHNDSGAFTTTTPGTAIDVESFVGGLLIGDFPTGKLSAPTNPPLDIKITMHSYVVIELDRKGNWAFRSDTDAVTTDDANLNEYFNLYHVLGLNTDGSVKSIQGTGQPVAAGDTSRENCNIAYFSVFSPSKRKSDSLNIYVGLSQMVGKHPNGVPMTDTLDVTLDPDIQNTGGGQIIIGGPGEKKSGRKSLGTR